MIKRNKLKTRNKRRFKVGDQEKEIIKLIGLGTLVLASFALPNLPIAIQQIDKIRGNKGLQKFFEKLRKKNIIYLGEEEIKLTARGKEILQNIQIEDIKIDRSKDWDGIWWLVSYDIPKKYNNSRDAFRAFLKRLGFYQVQDSLWVLPYECKEEIAISAQFLSISSFVIVMATDHLPNQEEMERHFQL